MIWKEVVSYQTYLIPLIYTVRRQFSWHAGFIQLSQQLVRDKEVVRKILLDAQGLLLKLLWADN